MKTLENLKILETIISEKESTIKIETSDEDILKINQILKGYHRQDSNKTKGKTSFNENGKPDNKERFFFFEVKEIRIINDDYASMYFILKEIGYYSRLKSIHEYCSIHDNLILETCNEDEINEAHEQRGYC